MLILQIMLIITNTAANGLVISVFIKVTKFRENLFNWYVFSLAAADLLVSFDMTQSFLKWYFEKRWLLGETGCNIFMTIVYSAVALSAIMIIIMSFDRYLCVSKPIKYKIYHKAPKTKKLVAAGIATVWLIVFVIYAVLSFGWIKLTGWKEIDYDIECDLQFHKSFSMNLVWIALQFVLPIALLSYLNVQVFLKMRRQARAVRSHSQIYTNTHASVREHASEPVNNLGVNIEVQGRPQRPVENPNANNLENKRKSVILLATYVVAFLICWIPFNVMILVDTLCATCSVSVNVYVACVYILNVNSIINPIIYSIRNPRFRRDLKTIFATSH